VSIEGAQVTGKEGLGPPGTDSCGAVCMSEGGAWEAGVSAGAQATW
jgi:hypothetical protein